VNENRSCAAISVRRQTAAPWSKLDDIIRAKPGWRQAGRNCEICDARSSDVAVHGSFLRPGVSLRRGLPEVEVAPMQIDIYTAVALVLSVLLLGYLTLTLLFPEKF
jgi:K+-transporting ATPase KdpF subunit